MNPNTNHTPGPWRVANGRIYSRAYQTALDLRLFVICDLDMGNDPRGEQESNARLIAAAPELLAACQALVAHITSLPDDTEKCRILKTALNNRAGDMISAAITKATQA